MASEYYYIAQKITHVPDQLCDINAHIEICVRVNYFVKSSYFLISKHAGILRVMSYGFVSQNCQLLIGVRKFSVYSPGYELAAHNILYHLRPCAAYEVSRSIPSGARFASQLGGSSDRWEQNSERGAKF